MANDASGRHQHVPLPLASGSAGRAGRVELLTGIEGALERDLAARMTVLETNPKDALAQLGRALMARDS